MMLQPFGLFEIEKNKKISADKNTRAVTNETVMRGRSYINPTISRQTLTSPPNLDFNFISDFNSFWLVLIAIHVPTLTLRALEAYQSVDYFPYLPSHEVDTHVLHVLGPLPPESPGAYHPPRNASENDKSLSDSFEQGLPRSGTPPNLAARMKRGLPEKTRLPNVKRIVVVSSAKGGVGKSTIAGT